MIEVVEQGGDEVGKSRGLGVEAEGRYKTGSKLGLEWPFAGPVSSKRALVSDSVIPPSGVRVGLSSRSSA